MKHLKSLIQYAITNDSYFSTLYFFGNGAPNSYETLLVESASEEEGLDGEPYLQHIELLGELLLRGINNFELTEVEQRSVISHLLTAQKQMTKHKPQRR